MARGRCRKPWANRVVLEITERSRLQGIEAWDESVERVTQMGFSIAVDDLGAGYSSLSVLAELQPSYIKVDMKECLKSDNLVERGLKCVRCQISVFY